MNDSGTIGHWPGRKSLPTIAPPKAPQRRGPFPNLRTDELDILRAISLRVEENYRFVEIGKEGRMFADILSLLKIIDYDRADDNR